MPTLLLRLSGPMQSWGTSSRFGERDTGKEPSKSGVIGLLAAAMGIDRENWADLQPLTRLRMAVRHDRPGTPKRDYQTAGCARDVVVVKNGKTKRYAIIKADGQLSEDGVVSRRDHLADAAFLVGLEGDDRALFERAHAKLRNPVWLLFLGRKSYVPSEPIWIADGLQDAPLREILARWPWIATLRKWEKRPEKLLVSWESEDGTGVLKMDQPLSSFAERRFGARFVTSEWIPFPEETSHVPA